MQGVISKLQNNYRQTLRIVDQFTATTDKQRQLGSVS